MKFIFKPAALIALGLAITISGCNKINSDDLTPSGTTLPGLTSIDNFFSKNEVKSQTFSINNNTSQTVTGAEGTVLTFDGNSFVTSTGAAVTGNINIELKEIYSKKNMLLSDIATIAEHTPGGVTEPLISGGEIYVNASQAGVQLKLGAGRNYKAFLPSATPDNNMNYFRGKETPQGLLWGQADSANLSVSYAPSGLFMHCDSLRWGNADRFMNAPSYTTISLNISGTFNASQIKAFLWYDNAKVVWPFRGTFNLVNNSYSDDHIAINTPAHIIVMSVKEGKLYTAVVAATIVSNASFNIALAATDETAFASLLSTLP